jgi:hypothetical protein
MNTEPSRQALACQGRSAKLKVTGKLKNALDAMVWAGARRAEAAAIAGITDHSLRAALKKPHVKAHYLAELGVLRESSRARTHHRLEELRDQDENKAAAVNAAKALEQLAETEHASGRSTQGIMPGLVIQLIHSPPPRTVNAAQQPPAIEGEPAPSTPVIPAPFAPSEPDPEPVDPTIFRVPRPW